MGSRCGQLEAVLATWADGARPNRVARLVICNEYSLAKTVVSQRLASSLLHPGRPAADTVFWRLKAAVAHCATFGGPMHPGADTAR